MRVIAEITTDPAGPKAIQAWDTITEMRDALSNATREHGTIMADVWRWPATAYSGDPFGLDVPTWRIIRDADHYVRTEIFTH
jgi:hypothetical protein